MTRALPELAPRQLYLIIWGDYVKIGCSVDPIDRLLRVTDRGQRPPRQYGVPELAGTVAGGFGAEAWLHAALGKWRAVGEWYHLRGPVAELVDAARRNGIDDVVRPTRARRAAVVRERLDPDSGLAIVATIATRLPADEALRHATVLPVPDDPDAVEADLVYAPLEVPVAALCGAAGRRLVGYFDAEHPRACERCVRALPEPE